jgi:hypothetical protein
MNGFTVPPTLLSRIFQDSQVYWEGMTSRKQARPGAENFNTIENRDYPFG